MRKRKKGSPKDNRVTSKQFKQLLLRIIAAQTTAIERLTKDFESHIAAGNGGLTPYTSEEIMKPITDAYRSGAHNRAQEPSFDNADQIQPGYQMRPKAPKRI